MGASGDNGPPAEAAPFPLLKEYPYEDGIAMPQDVFEEVVYRFECFSRAATPFAAANQLLKLNEAISDMRTWHPGHDINHDTMPWDREDQENG